MIFDGNILSEYLRILIPSLFVANIAAITLSWQYFRPIDKYSNMVHKKIQKKQNPIRNLEINGFENKDATGIVRNIPPVPDKSKIDLLRSNVSHIYHLMWTFFLSESIIIASYFLSLILIYPLCDGETCILFLYICVNISLIIFTIGLIQMSKHIRKKMKIIKKFQKEYIDQDEIMYNLAINP